MENAATYDEWSAAALELDALEGNERWKYEFGSDAYDAELIEARLDALHAARRSRDAKQMMFLLRAGLDRNLGGMGNPALYQVCHTGTKKLIQQYVDEVVYQLNYVADADVPGVTDAAKLRFFSDTRRAYGRSALLLSGGGGLGVFQAGVIGALFEQDLLPRIISGSSVGSIVGGILCTHTDDRLLDLLRPENMNLEAFERRDARQSLVRKLKRLFSEGYLCDIKVLEECVRGNMGDLTFEEAYRKTNRILNITVNSTKQFQEPRLLNFLTAPNVLIWSASCASCALPGLFRPVELMAKDAHGYIVAWEPQDSYSDGSIESDLPTERLAELFNVNQFIVCQVNPHAVPFLRSDPPLLLRIVPAWLRRLVSSEISYRMTQLWQMNWLPKAMRNLHTFLMQKYYGDITIVPDIRPRDYLRIFSNPEPKFIEAAVRAGQLAAWRSTHRRRAAHGSLADA